jgi:predicted Zn-dependent peptidase
MHGASQLNFINNNVGLFMLSIYIPSGSIYEHTGFFKDKHVSGISHFIEHLLYKHTEKYTGKEILQNFTKLGGFYNASTDKDQTMFYVKTLVENYELATDLLCEVVLKPQFKRNEVGTERKIVLEEYSQSEDDYDDILYKGSNKSILDISNIYLPPVIGKKSDLLKTDYKTLWQYYRQHFKDFMIVVNCDAKFKEQVKEHIVKRLFGGSQHILQNIDFYNHDMERHASKFVQKVIVDEQNTSQYNTCMTFASFPFKDYANNILLDFVKFCLTDAGLFSVLSYACLLYTSDAADE